jgi:hypothetical protein
MACPHVSGVAALGLSYAHKLGKKFSREEFISMLLTSVTDIAGRLMDNAMKTCGIENGSWLPEVDLGTYRGKMGTGAVDAWKFLMAIEGTPSVLVEAQAKTTIDLSPYCNPYDSYSISIDEASRASLGLASDPVIKNGCLEIECTKIGAGKIVLSSAVGKDTQIENGIGEMSYSREISIVSRPYAATNGGWL